MAKVFPLEKIFGSRTRVKVITLFTTGIRRPYFVREIARTVNERLNAVRRELESLEKIGLLKSYPEERRKYYVVNERFMLYNELASIMQKAGPGVEDMLFRNIERVGDLFFVCLTGYFTGYKLAPTDIFLVGQVNEKQLDIFARNVESQIHRELSYTPMTLNEYQYRMNFKDKFLQEIFSGPYKELVNKLPGSLMPQQVFAKGSSAAVRMPAT